MNVTMYECGFGDCFRLEDNNKNILYVDFGIHDHSMGKSKREYRYDQIIHSMPDNCDFLLTHYHDDHYAGALYMARSQSGKQFRNVYIPDIWRIHNSVDVIKLTLLRGVFSKSLLKNNLTLIDFLMMICNSSGKIHFVRRGDFIQKEYVALWPDENYVSNRTRDLLQKIYMRNNLMDDTWDALTRIAEKLQYIVIRMTDGNEPNVRSEMLDELQSLNEEYYRLGNSVVRDRNLQYNLYKYGNDISIVFQNKYDTSENILFENKNDSCRNILFTGDVGRKCWKPIIDNFDGQVPLYNVYKVIKIPHHGTRAYYHDIFSEKCNKRTKLLIPNGTIYRQSWYIYEQYLQDAYATNSHVVCSDGKALNTVSYNCMIHIIAQYNYFFTISV